MTAAELASALNAKREGAGWKARCPVPGHEDKKPSFTISEGGDGKVLFKCHSRCTQEEVIDALKARGLWGDNGTGTVTEWKIRDTDGKVVAVHHRRDLDDGSKRLWWSRNGSTGLQGLRCADLPLYGSERLIDRGRPLYIVEGEKSCDALIGAGEQAVASVTGAASCPSPDSLSVVEGCHCILWPDADSPGRSHMDKVARRIAGVAASVEVIPTAGESGADAADWNGSGKELPQAEDVGDTEDQSILAATLLADPDLLKPPPAVISRVVWENRITLLAGREKLAGKSTYAAAAVAALTSGGEFLGEKVEQGTVLWVGEEALSDTLANLDQFGFDPANLRLLPIVPNTIDHLPLVVAKHKPVLVVIDTLAAYAAREQPKSGDASAWLQITQPLREIARTGTSFLILHHKPKDGGSYRDSTAIGGDVDIIMELDVVGNGSKRHIQYQGRRFKDEFTVTLEGGTFRILEGMDRDEYLDGVVFDVIQRNPGVGSVKLRERAGAREVDVRASVTRLIAAGIVEDGGNDHAHKYHVLTYPESSDRPSPTASDLSDLSAQRDSGVSTDGIANGIPIRQGGIPSRDTPADVSESPETVDGLGRCVKCTSPYCDGGCGGSA